MWFDSFVTSMFYPILFGGGAWHAPIDPEKVKRQRHKLEREKQKNKEKIIKLKRMGLYETAEIRIPRLIN